MATRKSRRVEGYAWTLRSSWWYYTNPGEPETALIVPEGHTGRWIACTKAGGGSFRTENLEEAKRWAEITVQLEKASNA